MKGMNMLEPISSPTTSLQPSAATRKSVASLCKEGLLVPKGFSFLGLNGGNKHVGSDFSHQRFIPSAICRQAESFSSVCSGRTAPSSGLTLKKDANSLSYPTLGGGWYKKQRRGFQRAEIIKLNLFWLLLTVWKLQRADSPHSDVQLFNLGEETEWMQSAEG